MSYKYSKGQTVQGDIAGADDSNRDTKIDFEENYIGLEAGGSAVLVVSGSSVGIGTTTPDYTLDVAGNIGLNEYVYHNGDSNTYIRFQNDDINMQVGGTSMIKMDKGNNVVKINNANQDIDFKIKDSNSNVLFHADGGDAKIGIGTDSPACTFSVNGSVSMKITSIDNSDSTYSTAATDHIILVDSFAGAVAIDLPPCSGNSGRIIIVKDVGNRAGTNNITISRHGSDQIDGSNSIAISTNRGYVQLVSDGSQFWHQIAKEGVS